MAIVAILLFFALYFSMVVGFAYLTYWAIMFPLEVINKLTIVLKLGTIGGAAMLFVFSLKFIFKIRNFKPQNRIELNKADYPELLAFINQICMETGAPKPKRIYVDPDVNAYVSYSNTWLSLFLPVGKDLTIGMGLVDTVNLTEFKAIMAHEFGHFAQRSMKIGSYIVSANTIIHDMIFSRDSWDEALEGWRESDVRIAWMAWLITAVVWGIRQLLKLFYSLLNIMYSSLSREMEFNADKVAVQVTGSEAIISGLWKLDEGFSAWSSTENNAFLGLQQNIYVKNLYKHNQLALERNATLRSKTLQKCLKWKRSLLKSKKGRPF